MISHPRSGQTWVRFMLHEVRKRLHPWDLRGKGTQPENPVMVQDHDMMGLGTSAKRLWVKHGFKADQAPFRWRRWRVLFIARHPGDIVVSNWYRLHVRDHYDRKFGDRDLSLEEFVRDPTWGVETICRWMAFWANHRKDVVGFLPIFYEDMLEDSVRELKKILAWLPLACSDFVVTAAAEASSFERMNAIEWEQGKLFVDHRPMRRGRPDTMIVRRGKSGSWQQELSPASRELVYASIARLPSPFDRYRE